MEAWLLAFVKGDNDPQWAVAQLEMPLAYEGIRGTAVPTYDPMAKSPRFSGHVGRVCEHQVGSTCGAPVDEAKFIHQSSMGKTSEACVIECDRAIVGPDRRMWCEVSDRKRKVCGRYTFGLSYWVLSKDQSAILSGSSCSSARASWPRWH